VGCFDSVIVTCPKCKKGQLEFQSKAKECIMQIHNITEVPLVIAEDINGEWSICDKCDTKFSIHIPDNITTVAMFLKEK
jgi:hypothetical protein